MTMACRRVISRSRTNGEVEKVLIAIICPNVRCNKTRDVFFFGIRIFHSFKIRDSMLY
jgi:hypothetical protein